MNMIWHFLHNFPLSIDIVLDRLHYFQKLRPRLIVMAFNWIVATLCFYGLSLNAGIGSNVFTAFSLSAAMEVPAYIFSALVRYQNYL